MVPALEPVPMFFFGNPALGRCLARRSEAEEGHTMDPADEFNSPYVYVHNDPVNYLDPDGMWESPIYDIANGEFLGTDNQGLTGEAILMDFDDFYQGMDHDFAMIAGTLLSDFLQGDGTLRGKVFMHTLSLKLRPDYDGFVDIKEGIEWAREHPGALDNPTAWNTLYIDASKLDFGNLSVSNFSKAGIAQKQNLFTKENFKAAMSGNLKLASTVYALGKGDMILLNSACGTVSIVNNAATDYDWNYGGSWIRNLFIFHSRMSEGLNDLNGFRTYYYGTGKLNQ